MLLREDLIPNNPRNAKKEITRHERDWYKRELGCSFSEEEFERLKKIKKDPNFLPNTERFKERKFFETWLRNNKRFRKEYEMLKAAEEALYGK